MRRHDTLSAPLSGRPGPHGGGLPLQAGMLDQMLAAPEAAVTLQGLADLLFRQSLVLRLSGAADLVGDPGLPGRLRGALGEALRQTASAEALAGHACPWSPPCAFDALFRGKGRMTGGVDYPNPWLIHVDAQRGDLLVTLTLFGAASEWMPAVAELFTHAVRHHVVWHRLDGQEPDTIRRGRLPLPPRPELTGRQIITRQGLDPAPWQDSAEDGWMQPPEDEADDWADSREAQVRPPQAPETLALTFLSPVSLSGRSPRHIPEALLTTAGWRLEGMARWHGVTLEGAVDWRRMARAAERLTYDWLDAGTIAWTRGSRRQDKAIRMGGVTGTLEITLPQPEALPGRTRHANGPDSPHGGHRPQDDSRSADRQAHGPQSPDRRPEAGTGESLTDAQTADLLTLLRLGEVLHLGADTAFGCGRYRLDAA